MTLVALIVVLAPPTEAGPIDTEPRTGSVTVDKWWFVDPFEPMSVTFEIGLLIPNGAPGAPPVGLGGSPGTVIFQDLFSTAGVYEILKESDGGPSEDEPLVNQVLLVDDAPPTVPEPGVLLLVAGALAGLIARSRRR